MGDSGDSYTYERALVRARLEAERWRARAEAHGERAGDNEPYGPMGFTTTSVDPRDGEREAW